MRRIRVLASLGLFLLGAGCIWGCRREIPVNPDAPGPAVTTEKPTPAQLVAYMNDNARLLQSIKSARLEIDAKEGRESIGLIGSLSCEKPRDFRLRGHGGRPAGRGHRLQQR